MAQTITEEKQQFYTDVITGLKFPQKQLPSKYFYDVAGDRLFQEIMQCEDYYLTRCEMEIFKGSTASLVNAVLKNNDPFELIELGPGDCTKSIYLFEGLLDAGADFNYVPIDISENVINSLKIALPAALPNIKVSGMNGDYFQMLKKLKIESGKRKVILCLGANIGNMPVAKSYEFCKELRSYLSPGDLAIIGFDLVKNPKIIRAAYSDKDGITSRFNLNLLTRMNTELHTDFDTNAFEHYCSYDPETGSCKSYLVCLKDMDVHFSDDVITFKKDECIWLEISQKHTMKQIDDMAFANGFDTTEYLTDSNHWFTDAVWTAI